ncbi:hypothetical protein THRCLA_11230 [Thraustotheca clavata]|uniref:Uncharacterized protein n=1 Tax=Thraustotheca clavata TaxID=74557 RepID=A0A1V9Y8E8_9STRA|nr:hypothetical protein THRCLA_11230 [Thraustotheca clavata]
MDLKNLARRFSRSEDNTLNTPPPVPMFARPTAIDTTVPFGHNTGQNTGENDEVRRARRTRSKSECLMLAKNHSKSDLPTPCQDYISQIQLIMAKNESTRNRNGSSASTSSSTSSKSTPPTPIGQETTTPQYMHRRRSHSIATQDLPQTAK